MTTENCLNKAVLDSLKKLKDQLVSTRLRNMFIWLRQDVVRPIITREYPCILLLISFAKHFLNRK
jgi:hypothetical protein